MNQFQQRGDDARRAAAADWVVRLQSPHLSEDEAQSFDAWLSASPANAETYDATLAIMHAVEADAATILRDLPSRAPGRPSLGRGWLLAGGLAAAAALAIAIMPLGADAPAQTFTTGKGEHRSVHLADGSTVDLNAGSTLTVALGRHERRLALPQGEAVFDVAADASRPFLIAAGDRTVRVVGTRFDVRHRDDALSVTVDRGVVEVRPADGAPGQAFRLHAGQRLDHRQGQAEARVIAADPAEIFAWRTGRLIYRERPLGEVVADLNQQFVRPIRLSDPLLAATPVSGVLVLDDQAAVVRRLALLLPLKALPSDQSVLLQRDPAVKP